jgi:hypothetical protein
VHTPEVVRPVEATDVEGEPRAFLLRDSPPQLLHVRDVEDRVDLGVDAVEVE